MYLVSKSVGCFIVLALVVSNALLAQGQRELDGCVLQNVWCTGKLQLKLACLGYKATHFPFKEEFKAVQFITVSGNFKTMTFDPRYTEVTEVSVRYGDITEVSLNVFKPLKNLQKITIRAFPRETIKSYTYMNGRFVSDSGPTKTPYESGLAVVHLNGLEAMEEMRVINLSNNKISKIVGGSFKKSFPKLNALSLQNNKLVRFNFKKVPNTLSYLNLANNAIAKFKGKKALKNFSQLTKLYIAGNKVTTFNRKYLPPQYHRKRV